ncbi:ribose-phosphate pyrophosphokinase [Candidatus Roizmanbacteria bacterium]|nr:ribose-phosphate pyrophosphokinase [Candidatus Roizmanbacteria bacterium]
MKLFTGSANRKLAEEVAHLMGVNLAAAEIIRFGNSEVKVTVQETVQNETCVVLQSTSNPTDTHLMELALFCDALRREEAKKVIGVIPYFGYAKQNIQHRLGECVSINVVIRLLESIGFAKIYTFDIHDEGSGGIFSIPFKNISALPLLATQLNKYFVAKKIPLESIALVSPDQGAVEKVRRFGTVFYGTENFSECVIEKKRDQNIPHRAKPLDLYGNVNGKIAVIIDDMVVSGSTVIPAVSLCLERGARSVYSVVVHHDFIDGSSKRLQDSKLERFFTTNTIALTANQIFPKLEETSVAAIIANELKSVV